jgi:zinc/manganese transport system substrate-binding protein
MSSLAAKLLLAQRPRRLAASLLGLLLLAVAARPALAAEPLAVVASFSIVADLTQRIGGERVRLHTLVPANHDAHVYQPTPADAKHLARAALVVVNGLGFEGWIDRLVKSSGFRGRLVVASRGTPPLVPPQESHAAGPSHRHSSADPHAWQDARNALTYVDNIAQGLAEADPAGKAIYLANARRLHEEIVQVDAEIRALLGALPPERRVVVSSHDAFGHFERAYGVRFRAPVGVSTEAEASAAGVGKLIQLIRREKIPAVFMENVSDPRLLERIRHESGARIGGTLFSDALSSPGGPAPSYVALMRHNARTLASALAL